mmetsp:Transcript_52392/g.104114  ORF Transcript_52392/g.104114 Transcript_52392/m.104114 type:complete len:154 (+) Transcript_52392:1047-1508(+)
MLPMPPPSQHCSRRTMSCVCWWTLSRRTSRRSSPTWKQSNKLERLARELDATNGCSHRLARSDICGCTRSPLLGRVRCRWHCKDGGGQVLHTFRMHASAGSPEEASRGPCAIACDCMQVDAGEHERLEGRSAAAQSVLVVTKAVIWASGGVQP